MTILEKYIWVINTIFHAGEKGLSLKELNEKWLLNEDASNGKPIPRQTFDRWKGNILMSLGVLIECNWKDNFRYYIANPESLKNGTLNRWLLDTYATAQDLLQHSTLHDRILVELVPSSQKFLTDILNAIKETKLIRLSYRSFKRNKSYTFPVAPYCLKLFQRRWYLLALSINDNKIRVYGLDRVEHLEILKEAFVLPQDFNAHTYFSSYFGVVIEDSKSIERVIIRAYGKQQHYLRSLPLHESQQEVFTCDEYADFELLVRPTYDLCMELLKFGNMVEVMQPATLRHEMHNWAKDLWNIYKND